MEDQHIKKRALQLLRELTQAHGAPGGEDAVRRIFSAELDGAVHTDKTGNVYHVKRGSADGPRVMLTAHMDEVGFMVQSITKQGLLRFIPLGSWSAQTLLAQRVRVRTRAGNEIIGVIGAKPPHLLTGNERDKLPNIEEMFIDVGANDKEDVQDRLQIAMGDAIVPDSPFTQMFDSNFLLSKSFDDRVGLALVLQAVQELRETAHANTIYAVGTVQEEIGTRGAQTAVFETNPDVAVVLEGAPADDFPSVSEDERQGVLGQGAQVRIMDPSAMMNRKFTQFVLDLAKALEIPCQASVRRSGGTDARVIHLHRTGVPTVVLAVPARYIHTHNCMINLKDYENSLRLVMELLKRLDAETVADFSRFLD